MKLVTTIALGAALLACQAGSAAAQVKARGSAVGAMPDTHLNTPFQITPYLVGEGGGQGDETAAPASTYLWDNGEQDNVVAVLSTVNEHADSQAADDCWFKEGMWYDVQYVTVRMAVTNGFEPDTTLYVYPDCDGRPDESSMPEAYAQYEAYLVDTMYGLGVYDGYSVWEIVYHIDAFGPGEEVAWLSPVHHGDGLAFWLSANNGKVQGRQAQLKAEVFGLPDWTDADEELCCGICTDYYMKVEGKCCWRVLAQSDYVLDGLRDPIYAQNHPWTRTLDDFQLADPCKETEAWGICRIEAYFATNCDEETIYGEIFYNECDMPVDLTAAPYRIKPDRVEDTGETLDGLPVYRVTFICPPAVLESGCNYWFSIFSEQGAFLGKRSVWLYERRDECNIRLNEGKLYYPGISVDPATPVSELPLGPDAKRGFAYSVWVCHPERMSQDPDDTGNTGS